MEEIQYKERLDALPHPICVNCVPYVYLPAPLAAGEVGIGRGGGAEVESRGPISVDLGSSSGVS
jgi:hypothetical protein